MRYCQILPVCRYCADILQLLLNLVGYLDCQGAEDVAIYTSVRDGHRKWSAPVVAAKITKRVPYGGKNNTLNGKE